MGTADYKNEDTLRLGRILSIHSTHNNRVIVCVGKLMESEKTDGVAKGRTKESGYGAISIVVIP